MFHMDAARYGTMEAVRRHHGSTSPAENDRYVRRVVAIVAWLGMTEIAPSANDSCPHLTLSI